MISHFLHLPVLVILTPSLSNPNMLSSTSLSPDDLEKTEAGRRGLPEVWPPHTPTHLRLCPHTLPPLLSRARSVLPGKVSPLPARQVFSLLPAPGHLAASLPPTGIICCLPRTGSLVRVFSNRFCRGPASKYQALGAIQSLSQPLNSLCRRKAATDSSKTKQHGCVPIKNVFTEIGFEWD